MFLNKKNLVFSLLFFSLVSFKINSFSLDSLFAEKITINESYSKHATALLLLAIDAQAAEEVRAALLNNADPNVCIDDSTQNMQNISALHLAICSANTKIVQILLENKADKNAEIIIDKNAYDAYKYAQICRTDIKSYLEAVESSKEKSLDSAVKYIYDEHKNMLASYEEIIKLLEKSN